jgi:hypothetical protein
MRDTYFIRTWMPSTQKKHYTHTLTIYDNGDCQGFLIDDGKSQTEWMNFQFESRVSTQDGYKQETGFFQEEIPLHFLSTESYPASIVKTPELMRIFIPSWELLVTQSALDSPARTSSCPLPAASPQLPSSPHPAGPSQRHISRQRPGPSSLRQPKHQLPASPGPGKSHYLKPGQSQQNGRSTKNIAPRPSSSPSSNPASLSPQKLPNQGKPVPHRPQPGGGAQTGRRSKPFPRQSSQLPFSPASQHPQEQVSEPGKLASASPVPTSS